MYRPTRRTVMAGLGATLATRALGVEPAGPQRRLIVVLAYGGWDTTYALDPKPGLAAFDTPQGEVRRYADIPILTSPSRPSVSAFFEAVGSEAAVLHGISVKSLSHPQCLRKILTGDPGGKEPDLAAITASVLGRDRPLPHLVFGPGAYAGPLAATTARTGTTNQLANLVDPAGAPWAETGAAFVPDEVEEDAIVGWLRDGASGDTSDEADFRWSVAQARALDPHRDVFVGRGDVLSFEDQVDQARLALSHGLTWAVSLDSRLDFDTHEGNRRQDGYHELLFGRLLGLYDALASTPADTAGKTLLDVSTVVVVSEMTRTPKLTAGGGKDHWPYATLLAFGSGMAGGRVYGGTDDRGVGLPIDLASGDEGGVELSPVAVLAGLIENAGVDPAQWFDGEVFRGWFA